MLTGVGSLVVVGAGIGSFLLWGWVGVLALIGGLIALNLFSFACCKIANV